jgi:hypothetical protein
MPTRVLLGYSSRQCSSIARMSGGIRRRSAALMTPPSHRRRCHLYAPHCILKIIFIGD